MSQRLAEEVDFTARVKEQARGEDIEVWRVIGVSRIPAAVDVSTTGRFQFQPH